MDQANLDAMFDDMLGELDFISQQLEDTSDQTKSSPPAKKNERTSSFSQNLSSTADSSHDYPRVSVSEDTSDDIDLNAMLNDLTDWQHNLTSAQGQMPELKSASQDSGIGFNGNSLPRNANLSVQSGMEGSPQFNTLKRSTNSGPSVTFEENEDLSLASLEKDINKKEQDKARQLTPEELASLSPVMQELDDLVSDLSNLACQSENPRPNVPNQTTDKNTIHSCTEGFVDHQPGQQNGVFTNSHRNQSVRAVKEDTTGQAVNRLYHQEVGVSTTQNTNSVCSGQKAAQTASHTTQDNTSTALSENLMIGRGLPPRLPRQPSVGSGQLKKGVQTPTTSINENHSQDLLPTRKPKPPIPPPIATKPKIPDKPCVIHQIQRHPSVTTAEVKPVSHVKRQTSVKAPADLSNLLARRLQQNNFEDSPRSPTSPGPVSPQGSAQPLNRHNSIEMVPALTRPTLSRKHSTSGTSVKSNSSSASSAMSVKSNNSESSMSRGSRHSEGSISEQLSSRYNFAPSEIKSQLDSVSWHTDIDQLTPEEREERVKAEKMRIGLEKLKEARIQKLVVKVYNKDDSSKTLVVDERMTTRTVIKQLLEKNHYEPSINWSIIEELPSLFMERIFEEHELMTEMLTYWTRDTTNQVRFLERKDKYSLFRNPQHYLLSTSDTESQMADRQKQTLIEEFFSGISGTGVPEVQGILYLKGDSKSWSRKYCLLRTSGLYCSKSGEPKKGKKVSDLQCLVMFDQVCVYLGRGWKKKHKSPTDYGFSLKHPAIQTKSKHIKYFCCEDVRSLMRWIVGIRCAKYGKQLKENYDKTNDDMKSGNLVPSMAFQAQKSVDSTSTVSSDSGEAGSRQNTLPRANLSNVFEGAWQRANQQEHGGSEVHPEANVQRAKSVWKPQQAKSANWWELGASNKADDEDSETPTISNRTSGTSNFSSVVSNNRASISSTGSRGSYKESTTPTFVPASPQTAFVPPPPSPQMIAHPPPPPTMMNHPPPPPTMYNHAPPPPGPHINKGMPLSTPMNVHQSPFVNKSGPPPPPPKKMMPPPPSQKNFVPPPPLGNKPSRFGGMPPPPPQNTKYAPPPPPDDMLPPPPDDFLPPPPPMEDLPPPPQMEDDMPLPPPMQVAENPGLPKGLRSINGQAPVRLPFLPMFKNGNAFGGMRGSAAPGPRPMRFPPAPGPKPGPPPPPKHTPQMPPPPQNNYNYSNNKPPLLPRDNPPPPTRTPSYKKHSPQRPFSNPRYHDNPNYSTVQAPLTHYYNSNMGPDEEVTFGIDDFPPPPDFILDLKDTIQQVNHNDSTTRNLAQFDRPPPPPEMVLNELKSRRQPPPPPSKASKPAPMPPKRSPSTKLSFKR